MASARRVCWPRRTGRCWGCTGRGCGVCAAGRGGIMNKRILIIDDDVSIGNLVEEVLNGAGYDTLRAYSGTEALLLLKTQRPDLILLDLMLPGLSGEELLPQLSQFPVIVLSAKADVADKVYTRDLFKRD